MMNSSLFIVFALFLRFCQGAITGVYLVDASNSGHFSNDRISTRVIKDVGNNPQEIVLSNIFTEGNGVTIGLTLDTLGDIWSLEATKSGGGSVRFQADNLDFNDPNSRFFATVQTGTNTFNGFAPALVQGWIDDGSVTFTVTDSADSGNPFTFTITFIQTPPELEIPCLETTQTHTVTPLVPEPLDSGDAVRYCTTVQRVSDDSSGIIIDLKIEDPLFDAGSVRNIVVTPEPGFPAISYTDRIEAGNPPSLVIEADLFKGLTPNAIQDDLCYVVADGRTRDSAGAIQPPSGANDWLQRLNLTTGAVTDIGALGTSNTEAIALRWDTRELYAVDCPSNNYCVVGKLDLTEGGTGGAFVPVSTPNGSFRPGEIGQCCGYVTGSGYGCFDVEDADGLTWEPYKLELWASWRIGGSNLDRIFRIDPTAPDGQKCVKRTFTNGIGTNEDIDFVEVNVRLVTGATTIYDIDDMAFSVNKPPKLFAIANRAAEFGGLVEIDYLSPFLNDVSPGNNGAGSVIVKGTNFPIADFEGLGFSGDGRLFAVTGRQSVQVPNRNRLWQIDSTNGLIYGGVVPKVLEYDDGLGDYEAVDCLITNPSVDPRSPLISVCYDVTLQDTVVPETPVSSEATITLTCQRATNILTPQPPAVVQIKRPDVTGALVRSSDPCTTPNANIQIGELAFVQVTGRLIEGTHPNLRLQLRLPATIAAADLASSRVVSVGSNISPSAQAPAATLSGNLMIWTFGTTVNTADNVEDDKDLIVVEFAFRATNTGGVNSGTVLNVRPGMRWGSTTDLAPNIPLTVVEPALQVSIQLTPSSVPSGGTLQVCRTISHRPTSQACAHDVTSDVNLLPACITANGGTQVISGDVAASSGGSTAGGPVTFAVINQGQTATICYQATSTCPPPPATPPTPIRVCVAWDSVTGMAVLAEREYPVTPAVECDEDSITVPPQNGITLGNRVFVDVDNNNVQSTGDLPLANVVVRLLATDGTFLRSTTTDSNGLYSFNGLVTELPYIIEIDTTQSALDGVNRPATANVGGNDATDSDGSPSGNSVRVTTSRPINDGESDDTYDFGFQGVRIGDYVWRDNNYDGDQDPIGQEPPLNGVTVQLVQGNSVVDTTTTQSDGSWFFASYPTASQPNPVLEPNTAYTVRIPLNQAPLTTNPLQPTTTPPTDSNQSPDNDSNGQLAGTPPNLRAQASVTSPALGSTDDSIDFGFSPIFTIGNLVFEDTNGNGFQEPGSGEQGLPGVTVELLDNNNNVVATTTTTDGTSGPPGIYSFDSLSDNLSPNTQYRVCVPYGPTTTNTNAIGQRQPTVANEMALGDDETDSDGTFRATPTPGSCSPLFTAPLTPDDAIDFGFVPQLQIGDRVWFDLDGDGRQNTAAPNGNDVDGPAFVELRLCPTTGCATPIATTTTRAGGLYFFRSGPLDVPQLQPNTNYIVEIDFENSAQLTGANPAGRLKQPTVVVNNMPNNGGANDSNGEVVPAAANVKPSVVRARVRTPSFANNVRNTYDFGFVPQFRIGDRVWRDLNDNGIQDFGEPGIPGVQVQLFTVTGDRLLATDTTDSNGEYSFDSLQNDPTRNIIPGEQHRVVVQPQPGFLYSRFNEGNDDAVDSDGEPVNNELVALVTPPDFTDQLDTDFGFVPEFVIGDRFWLDNNENGIYEPATETGIDGVDIILLDSATGLERCRTTTQNGGQYRFVSTDPVCQLRQGTRYFVTTSLTTGPLAGLELTQTMGTTNPALDSNMVVATNDPNTGVIVVDVPSPAPAEDLTFDAGFVRVLSLGNYVWLDSNGDGVQGTSEPSIDGVVLELRRANAAPTSTPLATATTAGGGLYSFAAGLLPMTDYVVTINLQQSGMVTVRPSSGPAEMRALSELIPTLTGNAAIPPADDSNGVYDPNTDSVRGTRQTGALGSSVDDLDFGFVEIFRIGTRVFVDEDASGFYENGEAGVPGVTVQILQGTTVVATTTTDSNGVYSFNSKDDPIQPFTNYIIRIPSGQPAFDDLQPAEQNRPGNDAADSDSEPELDNTGTPTGGFIIPSVTTGTPSEDRLNNDFGFVGPTRVGNFVWIDDNANGLQDPAELSNGVSGVVVTLTRQSNGVVVGTTATQTDGTYSFDDLTYPLLVPGQRYIASIPTDPSYQATPVVRQTVGCGSTCTAQDSDGSPSTDGLRIEDIFDGPALGEADLTQDFGLVRDCTISGLLFEDANGNGQRAGSDALLGGLTVLLWDANDLSGPVATQTSAANSGAFEFNCFRDNLVPGTDYLITTDARTQLPRHKETGKDIGNDSTDSDGEFDSTLNLVKIPVTGPQFGDSSENNDFGFLPIIEIGDFVWNDLNRDDRQSSGEPGLVGVVVRLLPSAGNTPLATTATQAGGLYSFTSFDADMVPGTTYRVVIANNDPVLTADTLALVSANSGPDNTDSDATVVGSNSQISYVAPAYGTTDKTLDFGFVEPPPAGITLGDKVFLDGNNNGCQDTGEDGIAGVLVRLLLPNGNVVATTTTGSDGTYLFNSLDATSGLFNPNTNYVVAVGTDQNVLDGMQPANANNNACPGGDDNDSDGTDDGNDQVTTPPVNSGNDGNVDRSLDFGFTKLEFGNYVWSDDNNNGIQDVNEPGIANAVVRLIRVSNNREEERVTTDANGRYVFSSARPERHDLRENEDYLIRIRINPGGGFIPNNGYFPTTPNVATDATDARDSDGVIDSTGEFVQIPYNSGPFGTINYDQDFGFRRRTEIGDLVWRDDNGDGVKDNNEPGIEGVEVVLHRANALTVLDRTLTDDQGLYRFNSDDTSGFNPGQRYDIKVSLNDPKLRGFQLTDPNQGNDDTEDSDAVENTSQNVAVIANRPAPPLGQVDRTNDFGFTPFISVGDRIWFDEDGDGIQDNGEGGIPNVRVTLECPDGVQVAQTTTDSQGEYLFADSVQPNSRCTVRVDRNSSPLVGLIPSPDKQGNDDEVDSNCGDSFADTFSTGGVGSSKLDIDCGFVRPVSIGDFVWEDRDGEGDQDQFEPGLPGIEMLLFRQNDDPRSDTPLATKTTDNQGKFVFTASDGLVPNTCYLIATRMSNNGELGQTLFPTIRTRDGAAGVTTDSNGRFRFDRTHTAAEACTGRAGESRLDVDFGFVPAIELGDRVFEDENGDGEQDNIDRGVDGVEVRLFRQDVLGGRTEVCRTTTDSDGRWKLSSSDPDCQALFKPSQTDTYVVSIKRDQFPNRRSTVRDSPLANDEDDSDARPRLTGPFDDELYIERRITQWGVRDFSLDTGLVNVLEIGDTVWADTNRDGLNNDNSPLSGVTVVLERNNIVIDQTETDANGKYLFGQEGRPVLRELATYTVAVPLLNQGALSGVSPSPFRVGNNRQVDNDGQLNNQRSTVTLQTPRYGNRELQYDFGFQVEPPITIGDCVWVDINANGIQDFPQERGLGGIVVSLYTTSGELLATTASGSDCKYQFSSTNIPRITPNTPYKVAISEDQTPLADFRPTYERQGNDPTDDSDGVAGTFLNRKTIIADVTTGAVGSSSVDVDFGLFDCRKTDPAGSTVRALGAVTNNKGVIFTGNAVNDFTSSGSFYVQIDDKPTGCDPSVCTEIFPDVGVPFDLQGRISGWDMRSLYIAYSPTLDRLYVGIDCFGVCGDADGDGNPGLAVPKAGRQPTGQDLPNLESSETFTFFVDSNVDGVFDLAIGVNSFSSTSGNDFNSPNDFSGFGVYKYVDGSPTDKGKRYGQPLRSTYPLTTFASPSMARPDIEFTINNWSKLPGLTPSPYQWRVRFSAFAGSFVDAGIGEDNVPNDDTPLPLEFPCFAFQPKDKEEVPNVDVCPNLTIQQRGHDCCSIHEKGCSSPTIQNCVCRTDPWCCQSRWDRFCVQRVMTNNCGSCACSGSGSSPTPRPTPFPTPGGIIIRTPAPTPAGQVQVCAVRGTPGCACRTDGSCNAPFKCEGGFCADRESPVSQCPRLTPGCLCSQFGACNTPFNCVAGVCINRAASPNDTPAPTPAPTPMAGTDCVGREGRVGCPCGANGVCDGTNAFCEANVCRLPGPICAPGSPGCTCFGNSICNGDATCTGDNLCQRTSCTLGRVGEIGCPCTRDTGVGGCTAGNECRFGTCTPTGLCPANAGSCIQQCSPGTLGCTCDAQGGCGGQTSIQCVNNLCIVDNSPTPAPTPVGNTAAPTPPTPAPPGGNVGEDGCQYEDGESPSDGDGDGINDCSDTEVNLTRTDGKDVDVSIFDTNSPKQRVGSILFPAKDNQGPGPLVGNGKSVDSVRVSTARETIPDGEGGTILRATVINVDTDGVRDFTSPAFARVCLRGPLPDGLATSRCCLGVRDTGADEWKCGDNHLVAGNGGYYCGFAPHFSSFVLLPKPDTNELESADPQDKVDFAVGGEGSDDESSGLSDVALALIIAACVVACCLVLLCLFCLLGRKKDGRRGRERDVPMRSYEIESERDDTPTNVVSIADISDSSSSSSEIGDRRTGNGFTLPRTSITDADDELVAATLRRQATLPRVKHQEYESDSEEEELVKNDSSIIDLAIYSQLMGDDDEKW